MGAFQALDNLRLEKSYAPADTPHRFVWGGGYEMPVGRGKQFGRSMGRALDAVVGGWMINGFLTLQSGLPIKHRDGEPRAGRRRSAAGPHRESSGCQC